MPPPPQDHHSPTPGFRPLERKRSMSKPTDLDELIRLQEEEERRLRDTELAKCDGRSSKNENYQYQTST